MRRGQHLSRNRFLLLCQLPMPSVATHAVIDIGNLLNTNRLLVYHHQSYEKEFSFTV
uniref:Uncharacterized protein n=1 Tax=Oryza sativa subsp. japonica TaxID=39947 RepID=Q60EG6_ORYSJ|nr:hypothetical protein [Oryza sativa Japonica Group]